MPAHPMHLMRDFQRADDPGSPKQQPCKAGAAGVLHPAPGSVPTRDPEALRCSLAPWMYMMSSQSPQASHPASKPRIVYKVFAAVRCLHLSHLLLQPGACREAPSEPCPA